MCIIEKRTLIQSDNTRDVVSKVRQCHRARPGETTCDIVERKELSPVRLVDARSSSSRRPPAGDLVTVDRYGRENRYRYLNKRMSNRSSSGRNPMASGSRSPVDSSSPLSSTYDTREVKPRAPTPPPLSSSRRVSFNVPPSLTRTEAPDGTAIYSMPLSRGFPPAVEDDYPTLERQSSVSSLTNEVDDSEPFMQRRSSLKRISRSNDFYGSERADAPELSDLPRLRRDLQDHATNPRSKDKQRARVDSRMAESPAERLQREEDERQARILRASLERSEQRRPAYFPEDDAEYSGGFARETSEERRQRIRRDTAAALEGASASPGRADEMSERLAAELAQMENEKQAKLDRDRGFYPSGPSSPASTRDSYLYPPAASLPTQRTRPLPSARKITDTSATTYGTSRRYPVTLHNPPPGDPLAEQGDRIISQQQNRAMEETQRLAEMLERTELEDQLEGKRVDARHGSRLSRSSSKRHQDERRQRKEYRQDFGYNQ